MDRRLIAPLAGLVAAALVVAGLRAAPAGKPTPDVVIGELTKRTDGPVVELRGDETVTYWLVFERPADENRLAGFETGKRVKVTGRLAHGGVYRYVIVSTIDPDD